MSVRLIEIFDRSAAMLLQESLIPVNMLLLQGFSKAGTFGHSGNHISRSE